MGRLILCLAILCFGLSVLILGLATRLPVPDQALSSAGADSPEKMLQPMSTAGIVDGRAGTPRAVPSGQAVASGRMDDALNGAPATDSQLVGLLAGDLFPPGQAWLDSRGRTMVQSIAARLIPLAPGASVAVEGHTDDQPVRSDALGGYKSNDELSRRRARAVADLLAAAGVAESALLVRGWGAARPIDSNGTAEGRARNRRVEVILIPSIGQ